MKVIVPGGFLFLLISFASQIMAAGIEDIPVSINCERSSSIKQCIDAIGKTSGVIILCSHCRSGKITSQTKYDGSLKHVVSTLMDQSGLSSYSIQFDNTKNIVTISVVSATENTTEEEPFSTTGEEQPPLTHDESKALPGNAASKDLMDLEILPPSQPGEKGVTLREATQMEERNLLNHTDPDSPDAEVIPPVEGVPAMTLREVEKLQDPVRNPSDPDSLDTEVVPPTGDGKSMTLREMKALQEKRKNQDKFDSPDVEVIPPTADQKGMTLREVEKLQEKNRNAEFQSAVESGSIPTGQ